MNNSSLTTINLPDVTSVNIGTHPISTWYDPLPINAQILFPTYSDFQEIKDDIEESCAKTDKHVDELEEDIDFLNKERENLFAEIGALRAEVKFLQTENNTYADDLVRLKNLYKILQTELQILQLKLDNK